MSVEITVKWIGGDVYKSTKDLTSTSTCKTMKLSTSSNISVTALKLTSMRKMLARLQDFQVGSSLTKNRL